MHKVVKNILRDDIEPLPEQPDSEYDKGNYPNIWPFIGDIKRKRK